MIELSTIRWEESHKTKPRGAHYWRFRAEGKPSGSDNTLSVTYETDGAFPVARDNALAYMRYRFGTRADVVVELLP